jgi:hypothetical protein
MLQVLRSIKSRLVTKKAALVLVAPMMMLAMFVAPVGSLGSLGTQSASAACGTWYRYYNPDRILSYSSACTSYFDNNGWCVYVTYSNGSSWLRPDSGESCYWFYGG